MSATMLRPVAAVLCAVMMLGGCAAAEPDVVYSSSDVTTTTTSTTTTATTTSTTTATTTTTTTTAKTTTKKTTTTTKKVSPTTPPTPAEPRPDFAFTPQQVEALDELLGSYRKQVSVAFYDIESGYTYTYNAQQVYFVASIIKAPYCQYILELAQQGKTRLEDTVLYTREFYATGTGKLKNTPIGKAYSISTLTEYAIRYSDNVALRMLKSRYHAAGFTAYAKSIGIQNISGIKDINNGNIHATDALTYAKAIYRFITNGSPEGQKLRTDMLNTTNPMIVSTYPVVRKYGWATASFHDMAIVEAPHPYLLVILSDHDDGTAKDFAMFKTISQTIQSYTGQ